MATTKAARAGVPKRMVLVGLCFLATTLCYIDRVNISVAIIPMAVEQGWSATTKGLVLSSFFIGYMLAMAPGGWAANRFGGKVVLGWALLLWSLFTVLTPTAAASSFGVLIACRILMGAGEAVNFPAIVALFGKWLPLAERSRAQSLNFAGIPAGTVLGFAVSGLLVERYGWQASFHVFGVIGLVYALLWFRLVHESPARHPGIGADERALLAPLQRDPGVAPPVPWRALLLNRPAMALIINHFATTWTLYLVLTWLPSYFKDVQKLEIANAGLFSALPWAAAFVAGPIAGWIADRLVAGGMSVTHVRKIMQVTAMLGSAAGFLLATQVSDAGTALLVLCGTMALHACFGSGVGSNHLDIAPRHAAALYGVSNTVATIPGVVGVAVTGWLVDATGSYATAFAVAAGVNIVGALVWLVWAKGEPVVE